MASREPGEVGYGVIVKERTDRQLERTCEVEHVEHGRVALGTFNPSNVVAVELRGFGEFLL